MTPESRGADRRKGDRHVYPAVAVRFGADNERLWALALRLVTPDSAEDNLVKLTEAEVRKIVKVAVSEYLDRQYAGRPYHPSEGKSEQPQ